VAGVGGRQGRLRLEKPNARRACLPSGKRGTRFLFCLCLFPMASRSHSGGSKKGGPPGIPQNLDAERFVLSF
jgi:hypothetical protein